MADESLRLIAVNVDSPPLFSKATALHPREGYEVDVASAVAEALGKVVEWVYLPWPQMIPALNSGEAEAILCGQGVTDSRRALVDFTRPYAIFDEAVLVKAESGISSPGDLRGKRVLAIDGSTNLALARTFEGAEAIPFAATGENVLDDLISALRNGDVDAVVDDEVALQPLAESSDLAIGFSVPTANEWAIAVSKDDESNLKALDAALGQAFSSGAVRAAWERWMPTLRYPFDA
jgi:polar amino acid transport system substrate-binding protein